MIQTESMVIIPPGEQLSPFDAQRQIHELLAQETRFGIVQTVLGHPAHLPSLAELAYYTQKSESAVLDQLRTLADQQFVTSYELAESQQKRDLPGTFYGLTERGVLLLDRYDYLRGMSMVQAMHEHTAKTEKIRRHENAPRPALPEAVAGALGLADGTGEKHSSAGAALSEDVESRTFRELGPD